MHVIAGLPGSGKTNHVVGTLIKELLDAGRSVYLLNFHLTEDFYDTYHEVMTLDDKIKPFDNVGDVTVYQNTFFSVLHPAGDIYPNIRHWLPAGSVLIIDEAQHYFPSERNYRKPPSDFLRYLQTHRHEGHDFYFLTQSGQLLDTHIRKQCGAYFRLVRPFGWAYSRIERYSVYAPDDRLKPVNLEYKKRVRFNKQAFKLYTSTVVDTVKARTPFKLVIFFALIFGLILLGFFLYGFFGRGDIVVDKTVQEQLRQKAVNESSQQKTEGIDKNEYILVGGAKMGANYLYFFADSVTCVQHRFDDLLARGYRIQPLSTRSVRLNGHLLTLAVCVVQNNSLNKPMPILPKL